MARLISPVNPFAGIQAGYDEADYVVLGFPYDQTSTYRFGSRNAPQAVREASLNLETYSPRTGLFLENLKIRDLGDLEVSVENPFVELSQTLGGIFRDGKFPVVLGGEHSLTYSAAKALPDDVTLLIFDAHLDLKDIYEGRRFSHTTYLRRLSEELKAERFFVVGVRAMSSEEFEYARGRNIRYLPSRQILREGLGWALRKLEEWLEGNPRLYISFDMDVFDPCYAPAASNPEPEGLSPTLLLDIVEGLAPHAQQIVGFDLVEFSPAHDNGVTALLAAKIIFEVLCLVEAAGYGRRK